MAALKACDSKIARWTTTDPMGEFHSPYNGMGNNPVNLVDPTGGCTPAGNCMDNSRFLSALGRQIMGNILPSVSVSPSGSVFREGQQWFYLAEAQMRMSMMKMVPRELTKVPVTETWDRITNLRIVELDLRLQKPAKRFINEVDSKLGIRLRITTGYRTVSEQNILYAQGRTTPGEIVTNAKGGESFHNYGLAFDVVIMRNGLPIWDRIPTNVGLIAERYGFEWGGRWRTFPDYPHFQMTFGQTIPQLQKKKR